MNSSEVQEAISSGTLLELISSCDVKDIKALGPLVATMHNDGHLDVIELYSDWNGIGESTFDTMSLFRGLEYAAKTLKCGAEEFIELIHQLSKKYSHPEGYILVKIYENWSNANAELMSVVSSMIGKYEEDSAYLHQTIVSWRSIDPIAAFSEARTFTQNSKPGLRQQAILALSSFDCDFLEKDTYVEQLFIELSQSADDSDVCTVIRASIRILENCGSERYSRLHDAIHALVVNPSQDVLLELLSGFAHHRSIFSTDFENDIFTLVKAIPSENHQAIQNVDLVLYNLDFVIDRDRIHQTMTALMTLESAPSMLSTLSMTESKIQSSSHSLLGWHVISWLFAGNYSVCNQLTGLFKPLDIDLYDFRVEEVTKNPAEIFYVARKVFGYFMLCRGPSVSLLSSCLAALEFVDRKRLEIDIVGFWLRNYPDDISLFIKHSELFSHKGMKASVARINKLHKENTKGLKDVTANAVFKPSYSEQRVQQEIARQTQTEIEKNAEHQSVFMQIVKKSRLLYGSSAASYIGSNEGVAPVRNEIQMNSYEFSTAKPKMQVLSSARLNYLILQFRKEQRPT